MTKKYDDFIADLQLLLEKHGVWVGFNYDECLIIDIEQKNQFFELTELLEDATTE